MLIFFSLNHSNSLLLFENVYVSLWILNFGIVRVSVVHYNIRIKIIEIWSSVLVVI